MPNQDRKALPTYLSSFIAMGVCTMLLGPSLDTLQATSGTRAADIGILFTASSIGYLLGVTASGQWVARHTAHVALRAGLVMMAVAVAALPSMHSLAAIFAFEVLLGFGIGWIEVPANSAILWRWGGGRAINALHACFAIGAVAAPVIVGRSIAWTDGIGLGYAIAAVIALLPLLLLHGYPSPANPHVDHGRGVPRGARGLVVAGTIFFLFYVGSEITFAGWIYRYAQDRGFATADTATTYGALFLGAFAIGRIVGVPVARHLSGLQMLYLDHVVALAALVLIAVARDSKLALVAGTILFGLGVASMFASMLSVSEAHVAATGTVTSIYLVGSSLGSMTLPWATGRLLSHYGPGALPVVGLVSTVLTLAAVAAFQTLARRGGNA